MVLMLVDGTFAACQVRRRVDALSRTHMGQSAGDRHDSVIHANQSPSTLCALPQAIDAPQVSLSLSGLAQRLPRCLLFVCIAQWLFAVYHNP